MSKLEVDKIDPQSGTDLELGSSGDTITIPTGVTLDASNATTTLPSNIVTTDGSQTLTNKSIAATQLTGTITPSDNTVSLAKLTATGTKDATTFLRGDNSFAEVTSGLTIVDVWRLTADITNTNAVITSNLEQPDTDGATTIGSAMTQSSGIFTFPETGKWLIICSAQIASGGGPGDSVFLNTQTTTDGTNYDDAASVRSDVPDGVGDTGSSFFLFDVTNTTTHKVRFNASGMSDGGSSIKGDTGYNATCFIFQKLGDT